ncbi:MAG: hypothetical protein JW807_16910 [Spirochaetes bacterium]|nr:hypothetical protein [Spirochaetota bacterium]
MEVRCTGCNQKYVIPDDRLRDKLSYFVCETCGETIALKPRGGDVGGAAVSAKDILEGIYLSFNLKSFLISAVGMFIICTVVFSALATAGAFQEFISGWPLLGWTAGAAVVLLCLLIFDITLYLVSRNTAHRISTGRDTRFSEEQPELYRDLALVAVISIGMILAFLLVLAPVGFIGDGWVLYTGLLYPVIVFLAVVLFLSQWTRGMLFAFIAMKNWTVADTLRGFLRFLGRENVNIPVYMMLISFVSSVFTVLLVLLLGCGVALALAAVSVIAGTGIAGQLLSGGLTSFTSLPGAGAPFLAQAGIVLIVVFSYMLFLAVAAYCVVLFQTLTVVAVTIMESNPGRSVNRVAVLVCMAIPAALAVVATVLYLI